MCIEPCALNIPFFADLCTASRFLVAGADCRCAAETLDGKGFARFGTYRCLLLT
jgi:hypothetical protein